MYISASIFENYDGRRKTGYTPRKSSIGITERSLYSYIKLPKSSPREKYYTIGKGSWSMQFGDFSRVVLKAAKSERPPPFSLRNEDLP